MKQKALLLFQLFLLILAFFVLLNYSGNQRLLISLACLLSTFLVAKVETIFTERGKQDKDHVDEVEKKGDKKARLQALHCLLKSKNVLLLTDAIHYLLQDLGLPVLPTADYPAIDRLIRIPGSEVTYGLKILGDVSELNENWDKWDEVASFDQGKGGKRRLLIIGSNRKNNAGDSRREYKDFSLNTQLLLSAKQVVAMTTLTLYEIYVWCKKREVDIKTVFHPIHHHPGGVFELENFAR